MKKNLFRNRVGSTITTDNVLESIQALHYNNQRVCQIWLGEKTFSITEKERKEINEFLYYKLMDYYIHAPVNVNLASTKASRSVKIINSILDQKVKCIVHCGVSDNYDTISDNLSKLRSGAILENSAGQSRQLGSSIDDIERIVRGVKGGIPLCIDTQHAFAAGVTKWDSMKESKRILDRYNKISKVRLVHLNDSAVEFNSHVDRHALPTKGYIWKRTENREGLWGILKWCEDKDVDVVIEMNDVLGGVELLRSIRDLYVGL